MTSRRLLQSLAVVFVILFIGWPAQGQDQASWPMFQYDPAHTGLAPVVTQDQLSLRYQAGCQLFGGSSHLVIAPGETVWVTEHLKAVGFTWNGLVKAELVAPNADFDWFVSRGSFAVTGDGKLIGLAEKTTGMDDRAVLFAASSQGSVEWAVELDGAPGNRSQLTLGHDGAIYVGLNRLWVVTQGGELLWSYTPPEEVTTFPAVDTEGNVSFGCRDGLLYCLDSGGTLRWSFDDITYKYGVNSDPTIDEAGNVYYLVDKSGLVALAPDGTLKFNYPVNAFAYTSPVLLPGGSVGFVCPDPDKPESSLFVRLDSDGQLEWQAQLSGSTLLCSPAADAAGNVFVSGSYGMYPDDVCYLTRLSPRGTLATICTTGSGDISGPCIGCDGTVYACLGDMLHAFGPSGPLPSVDISTRWAGNDPQLGPIQSASLRLLNPGTEVDADCYVAYRRIDSDELFFYPFWSNEPSGCALEFRPLPGGSEFTEIELIHLQQWGLDPGQYECLAGLFEPGTFSPLCEIAACEFTVDARRSQDQAALFCEQTTTAFNSVLQASPPTIQLWTDKAEYIAGEMLHLSLNLENQGFGMPFDLYIAATMDADPNGTLYFFPTWATDPSFTNISFLPLPQGASLPDLTIMHLPLWDGLPTGDYRFLAAFFVSGRFDLASDIAEARWTLM